MESLRRLTSSVFDGGGGGGGGGGGHHLGRRHSGSGLSAFPFLPLNSGDPLELTYVTEQLVVCGFPVAAPTNRKANTANADELAHALETRHGGHYLVFNLNALDEQHAADGACASPAATSSAATAPTLMEQLWKKAATAPPPTLDAHAIAEKLREQMLEFSWERDGMKAHTPPFDLVFRICYSIFAWLSLDAQNVAVVHCQSGKTRSGVVVACYLLFARLADDPIDAFVAFYRKRWDMRSLTPQALRSKTPPSIQRFLASFHELVEYQKPPNDRPMLLKAIIFRALPVELRPCVQIWDDYQMVFCTDSVVNGGATAATAATAGGGVVGKDPPVLDWSGDDGFLAILWENGVELDGGFSILCSFGDEYDSNGDDVDASSRVLFRYADSTWFLSPGLVTLTKRKLDMMKQYEHGFDDEQFSVDLVLHENSSAKAAAARRQHVRLDYTGNNAVRQGLIEVTKHHMVLPDPAMHSNFLRMGFGETPTTFALQRSQNTPNAALDLLHSEGLAACFAKESPGKPSLDAGAPAVPQMPTGEPTTSPVDTALRRQTTAEIVAMQSQRSRYSIPTAVDASTCHVCKDDDYMMRPQIVRCTGKCGSFYHTTCVGLRKIPFGLTTLSDRTNHSVYVKKFFSAWECDTCAPPPVPPTTGIRPSASAINVPPGMTLVPSAWASSYVPAAASPVPTALGESSDQLTTTKDVRSSGASAAPVGVSDLTTSTPASSFSESAMHMLAAHRDGVTNEVESESAKLDKLRDFLLSSGVSVEDLLRAATTPNVSIAPTPPKERGYATMLARGVPFEAVQNCMVKDGADPSTLRQARQEERSEPLAAQELPPDATKQRLKDVEEFRSYFSMLRLGCPKDAVKHKLVMDGLDPLIVDLGPDAIYDDVKHKITVVLAPEDRSRLQDDIKSAATPADASDVLLKDHDVYAKYFRMLKMGLPEDAVGHKIRSEGADERALDLGGDARFSKLAETTPVAATLGDDPVYAKYFKMLKMGLPDGAVRHKMVTDGVDAKALDLGPDALVTELTSRSGGGDGTSVVAGNSSASQAPKPKQRRKKLHWQAISDDRLSGLNQQTIWEDKGDDEVDFDMDMDELESLFFSNKDANSTSSGGKKKAGSSGKALKRKQSVSLVDGKRAMNAAISLARVRLSYSAIADAVQAFDARGLSLQQLTGINEFLPTPEEVAVVAAYTGDVAMLGEAEKFFLEISKVKRYAPRMECLVFKLAFPSRSAELQASYSNMIKACEEVKGSRLLKILLSVVLKLGNTLNGSGDDNGIRGFTVDSLLRLGHTKAVNQKTTVLHYLVRLVKKNHPQVLDFQAELRSVPLAARESFETITEDFARLQTGFLKLNAELDLLTRHSKERGSDPLTSATADAMQAAATEIDAEIHQLNDEIRRARDEVSSVFDYFGEDPSKNPTDFFTTLTSFCTAFEFARKEVDAADEAAMRAERLKLRRSGSVTSRPQGPTTAKDAAKSEVATLCDAGHL
ncbi:hypothetical protein PybrP1_010846 [[Pythium] brassicae (nom. inval.)]|nr:hypothetical protein PybrP1_010846 [[Pythium] brassicae (nom. inval.)]